jgi:hypothetical protein
MPCLASGALKDDKAKALAMFNKGEGGFKDRDLYVFCANASDGVITAHPYLKVAVTDRTANVSLPQPR